MKKRLLSIVMVLAMISAMIVPIGAATPVDGFHVDLEGVTGTSDNVDIVMSFKLTAQSAKSLQTITFVLDTSKLQLASLGNGNLIPITNDGLTSIANSGPNSGRFVLTESGAGTTMSVYGAVVDSNHVMIRIEQNLGSDDWENFFEDGLTIMSFGLKYADGVTFDQLDSGSIRIASVEEAGSKNTLDVAKVTNGSGTIYRYGVSVSDSGVITPDQESDDMVKPIITIDGQVLPCALGNVEVVMEYTAVNAPELLPTTEGDRKVAVKSVKPLDTAGNEFDATEAAKVKYTYSLKKAGETEADPAVELTDAEKAYFSIDDTTGEVTIKAGAPIIDLRIVASGSYTNTNGNVSTADGEGSLAVKHGNVGDIEGGDPSDDAAPKFSGVKVEKGGVVVVTSATGSTYSETVAIPTGTENNTATFVGTAVDQFGDPFDGVTGAWDDTVATGDAAVTVGNGKITVTPAASGADFDYKFSASDGTDTYEAKVDVTVSNTVVVWPTLTNNTIVYGQPISDFTFDDSAATVTDHGTDVTDSAVFAWDVADDTATLNASTNKLTMKVTFTDSASASQTIIKDYAITVNKADQVITIDQDGETETTLVNVEIGLDTDLAPVVKNKTVDTATGMSTVTYGELSGATGLVTHNGSGVLHGERLSADNSDVVTMTLTAAENDNYNAATRTITFSVSNQILRANIVFDQPTPIAGRDLVATVTESTNPVQDNSLFDASGNMIGGLSHSWFRWSGVEGEDPVEIEGAASTMTQPSASVEEIKVTYKPVAQDVGKYLILTIVTPTGNASYQYIDKSSQATAQAVIKGTPAKPSLAIQGTTTSSITITAVDGAEYALIAKASIPAAIDGETQDTPTVPDTAWQDSNEFTGLTPNTKYDAYIRLKETGVDNASEIETMEASTDAISIDPENPSTNPAVVFTTTPAVTITGDAKYNETLTANLTDAEFTLDGVAQTGPFYTEYQWYRTTPAVPDNPETADVDESAEAVESKIDGATGTTYILTKEDIGKTITVKVTPAATSQFGGEVSATTATVEKADATSAPTGITNTTKATSATSADGVLSGVDDTMEYRLKAAEGAEPAVWTGVSASATELTGLAAGTYEIRFKETDTHKASDAAEVAVEVNGFNITGKVQSYNAKVATTYTLSKLEEGNYTVVKTGTLVDAEASSTADMVESEFAIDGVPNGTYKLVISKQYQLNYTITNIVVNNGDVDLTVKTSLAVITLCAGDVTGDGVIESSDQSLVIDSGNYFKDNASATDPETDVNGDNITESDDQSLLLNNYFKSNSDFEFDFATIS